MGRREKNKREKRERLEAEGLRLFLDQGYDRTSIEQIAAGSGVARGTFYLYFSDKAELFETLVDRWFEPLLDLLRDVHDRLEEATSREQSVAIYQALSLGIAMHSTQHRDVLLLTFRESRHAGEAGERIRRKEVQLDEVVTQLTVVAADRGLITADNPELVSLVILGAIERLFFEYLSGRDIGDPTVLGVEVVQLIGKMLDLPS